jgi:tetratricopeptide (TPR) repeat protein
MWRRAMAGGLWLLCFAAFAPMAAQQPPAASAPKPDYSQEPYILESAFNHIVLEKDGTSTQESSARVRIQSAAGLRAFGLLRFPYESATSTLEIESVRVLKPDGRVVETPRENAIEMPADITRVAPFYSDLKEKQLAVRGLEVGDTLEFQYRIHVHSPLDPGHYWYLFNFTKQAIVLKEQWRFTLPRDRYVKVQSRNVQPAITEAGGYREYTWTTSNLKHKTDDQQASVQAANAQETPDVQITTFRSWEEVGDWFRSLVGPRAVPTAEIRAKAAELTRGAADDAQKIQGIYQYVSTKIRYIGVSLGIGRYQPHAAAEVLSNEYGDCKDKHTLFASLLSAAGFKAGAALVSSVWKIDPEVPSPGQFDHLVSVMPQGQGFDWMDTTAEVAPVGYLMPTLRDKQALVIPTSGPARLVTTPADPPFLSVMDFQMDATLDDKGTLTGKAQLTLRGDLEILLRLAYRQAGRTEWNDVTQKISGGLGFGGTVSDAEVDPPEATGTAFHIRYQYTRKDFGNWASRQIPAAEPPIVLPEAPAETEKNPEAVDLGSPVEYSMRSNIALPKGLAPQLLPTVSLKEDFATYRSTTSFSNGVWHVERQMTETERRVPPAQFAAYRKFRKEMLDTWMAMVPLSADESTVAMANSDNPEAQDAFEKGQEAMRNADVFHALRWFQTAVEKDPKFARAWFSLSLAHYGLGALTDAAKEASRGIEADPGQASHGKAIARRIQSLGRPEAALLVWRAVEKANPKDTDAPKNIGSLLIDLKRYAEAVPELEAAADRDPKDLNTQYMLGTVYLHTGKKDRGFAAFQKVLALDSNPEALNDVAYSLAEEDFHLEEALDYAQRAVADDEEQTEQISLDELQDKDFNRVTSLSYFWDTLGWVYFKMGRFDAARRFLNAAWILGQQGVVGDHLGQALVKLGRKQEAARTYARAIAARGAPDETLEKLIALLGSRKLAEQAIEKARGELSQMRSVKLPLLTRESASAEFYILFQRGAGAKAAKFIKGAESLRGAVPSLLSASYDVPFPDDAPTRIVRRGILGCEREPAGCQFFLLVPGSVHITSTEPPKEPDEERPPSSTVPGSWSEAALPFRPFQVAVNGSTFWVSGTDEGIASSNDGGRTWQVRHRNADGEVLLHIGALNDKLIYAAGTHGVLLWSRDGGDSWTSTRSGKETVQRISFADESHGIRQAGGRVETTSDGGARWVEVAALKADDQVRPFTETLGLAALDAAHMAITVHQPEGENGFFATQDGGKTWKFAHVDDTFAGMLYTHGGEYWAFGIVYLDRQIRGGYGVGFSLHSKDGLNWTRGLRSPNEFENCTPQGCYLWDGALVDLYGEKPRFWSLPQDGSLTNDWALAGGEVCSVGRTLKCAHTVSASAPPERPEQNRPYIGGYIAPKLSGNCLRCEFESFPDNAEFRYRGTLRVDFVVQKNGTVADVVVSAAPKQQVADAVRTQFEGFIFVPPRRDGAPVSTRMRALVGVECMAFRGNTQSSCGISFGSPLVTLSD